MLIINSGYKNIIFLFKWKAVEQDTRCLFTAWRVPNLPLSLHMNKKFELRHGSSFQEQMEEQHVHCWARRKACHALYAFCLNSFRTGFIGPMLSPQPVAQLGHFTNPVRKAGLEQSSSPFPRCPWTCRQPEKYSPCTDKDTAIGVSLHGKI